MKYFVILLGVFIMAGVASADPRMETLDNFCHYILSAENTDNEIFMAGCGSRIKVFDGIAQGYARVESIVGEKEISALRLRPVWITSKDSDAACAMVDSNGTQYLSDYWTSQIKFNTTYYRDYNNRFRKKVTVFYELICRDGVSD